MAEIRYAQLSDREFWYRLDRHLTEAEFEQKVNGKRAYVILSEGVPAGLLRYNLFWDNIPFCTMLYVKEAYRGKGFGRLLMEHWEKEMKQLGYGMVLTSTQADELAQHFYRSARSWSSRCRRE